MEIKKTVNADLERLRPKTLFMGLVIAIAVFVVALEFSLPVSDGLLDDDFLDEIAEDMEMMPPIDQDVMSEPDKTPPSQSDQVVVVENLAEQEAKDEETLTELVTETEVEEEKLDPEEDVKLTSEEEEEEKVVPLGELEHLPQFPGGMASLIKWLTQNLKYPESAKLNKVSGRVIVSFMVNADGSVADVKIVRPVDPVLDREALRVVRMMPKWEPGVSGGRTCRTLVHLPVVFKL